MFFADGTSNTVISVSYRCDKYYVDVNSGQRELLVKLQYHATRCLDISIISVLFR